MGRRWTARPCWRRAAACAAPGAAPAHLCRHVEQWLAAEAAGLGGGRRGQGGHASGRAAVRSPCCTPEPLSRWAVGLAAPRFFSLSPTRPNKRFWATEAHLLAQRVLCNGARSADGCVADHQPVHPLRQRHRRNVCREAAATLAGGVGPAPGMRRGGSRGAAAARLWCVAQRALIATAHPIPPHPPSMSSRVKSGAIFTSSGGGPPGPAQLMRSRVCGRPGGGAAMIWLDGLSEAAGGGRMLALWEGCSRSRQTGEHPGTRLGVPRLPWPIPQHPLVPAPPTCFTDLTSASSSLRPCSDRRPAGGRTALRHSLCRHGRGCPIQYGSCTLVCTCMPPPCIPSPAQIP